MDDPQVIEFIDTFPDLPQETQEMVLNAPAMEPPEGVVPNFDNPPSGNDLAIAVLVVCLVPTILAIVGRIYARALVVKKVEAQDYIGLVATVAYASLMWCYLAFLTQCGFYVHSWDLRIRDIGPALRIGVVALPITFAGVQLFAKVAILLEWIRVFALKRTRLWLFRGTLAMLVLNIIVYLASIIATAVLTTEEYTFATPWFSGRIAVFRALGLTTAFFNVAMDVIILLLPQSVIWKLKVDKTRRIGISLVFSVGLLALGCAIGRVVVTFNVDLAIDGEPSYTLSPVFLWSFAEASCVLLVFCLPALPKVFKEPKSGSEKARSRRWKGFRYVSTSENSSDDRSKRSTDARPPESDDYAGLEANRSTNVEHEQSFRYG